MSNEAAPSREAIMDKLKTALGRMTTPASGAPAVSESTRLREDLGLDSFAAIELVFEVEDLLDVRIPQSAAVAFRTVDDVISFVSAELAKPRVEVSVESAP